MNLRAAQHTETVNHHTFTTLRTLVRCVLFHCQVLVSSSDQRLPNTPVLPPYKSSLQYPVATPGPDWTSRHPIPIVHWTFPSTTYTSQEIVDSYYNLLSTQVPRIDSSSLYISTMYLYLYLYLRPAHKPRAWPRPACDRYRVQYRIVIKVHGTAHKLNKYQVLQRSL